jgi:hypothetical protein
MGTRRPAVAGMFYPADPAALRAAVAAMAPPDGAARPAIAVLVPHAGYAYSGRVAGATWARVAVPRLVCLLATNHTGSGPAFAVWPGGRWVSPLGDVPIDDRLTRAVLDGCPEAEEDASSEEGEHSAEVQVPFLLHRNPGVRMAVVTVSHGRLPFRERAARLRAFGEALGRVAASAVEPVLVAASSDMSHVGASFAQEPPPEDTADAFARAQDRSALDRYLALDAAAFERVVREQRVSMCGWAPALVALAAATAQGATRAELVRYATSAEVSGDRDHVVGYAGVLIA